MANLVTLIFTILGFLYGVNIFLNIIFAIPYPVHTNGGVLVTGASSGIGKYTVEYLANHTSFVIYAAVRKQAVCKPLIYVYLNFIYL